MHQVTNLNNLSCKIFSVSYCGILGYEIIVVCYNNLYAVTQGNETLFHNWQKESWQTFEETSGYVRPERVNKWPSSMTDVIIKITNRCDFLYYVFISFFLVFSLHVSGLHGPIIRGISSCCFYATIWFMQCFVDRLRASADWFVVVTSAYIYKRCTVWKT